MTALYDAENAGRDDFAYYVALAGRSVSQDVVDIGCGTGELACQLAEHGHRTTGVDPAAAMLEVARARHGGDQVSWIEGTAADLPADAFDLAVMSGHVAQVFLTEGDWGRLLAHVARALRVGGLLAFESRNPEAEGWRRWTREHSYGTACTDGGQDFDSWVQVTSVTDGFVHLEGHAVLRPSGDHLTSPSTLRFRTQDELHRSLEAAGFRVRDVVGDWDGRPPGPERPELIFHAERR